MPFIFNVTEPKHIVNNITKNVKFCFITSSYNQSQFIIFNLNSIRLQMYTNFRVIYVNDNSTDDSLKILQTYIRKYPTFKITLINNETRYGPAYSRKIAYDKCTDDEICVFFGWR